MVSCSWSEKDLASLVGITLLPSAAVVAVFVVVEMVEVVVGEEDCTGLGVAVVRFEEEFNMDPPPNPAAAPPPPPTGAAVAIVFDVVLALLTFAFGFPIVFAGRGEGVPCERTFMGVATGAWILNGFADPPDPVPDAVAEALEEDMTTSVFP